MFSRRSFLKASVAVASGLILPSWLEKAERFIQLEAEPYFERPATAQQVLYAVLSHSGEVKGYELFLGNPYEEPDTNLTWEHFIETYDGAIYDYEWAEQSYDSAPLLHHKVDRTLVFERWLSEGCPGTKAYKFLEKLDLGVEINKHERGSINFYDGFSPAHDAQVVSASDLLSLSLLQQRLNQLGCSTVIEI